MQLGVLALEVRTLKGIGHAKVALNGRLLSREKILAYAEKAGKEKWT